MSLIHGILALTDNIANEKHIQTMAQALQRFTPDGTAYWQQDKVALAANLLKTLPEGRHELNPVVNDNKAQLSIVGDVRIDNRDELCRLLSIDKKVMSSLSDVRLILMAYQHWGDQCAVKLIGDFAFAIWDQAQQCLFCSRDVFAQRPFYYYHSKDWFIFSSDLDALLALDIIPTTLDEGFIADQIGGLHLYSNNTPYHEINCLEAAHSLTLEDKKISFHHYWQPDLNYQLNYSQDEQYVEHYLELFTEAVRCRLVSDAPISSFISGGLDASSISAVASSLLQTENKKLFSFCHVLPAEESNPEEDEKALVQILSAKTDIPVNWVSYDLFDADQLKQMNEDQSVNNPFLLTSLKLAKQQGSNVFLCGFGGDQIATCHARDLSYWQLRQGNYSGFYTHAKTIAKERKKNIVRIMAGLLWHFNPMQSQIASDKTIRKHLFETCVYNSDFAQRIDIMAFARTAHRFNGGSPRTFRESIWKDLSEGVNPHNQSAAIFTRAQMEARHPMFDRRLVEFCLAVPPEQHRQGLLGRQLIRRAMKGILPDELRLRHNKRYSSNPGIQKHMTDKLPTYTARLAKGFANKQIAQYIDLQKIQTRLDALPELIAQNKQNEFKLGATGRALMLIDFLSDYYLPRE